MRSLPFHRPIHVVAVIAALVSGCNDASHIAGPTSSIPGRSQPAFADAAVVQVANVEQLYAAVNEPANAGTTIRLAAGTYVLSARNPSGVLRPNGGRVELQQDMSISGVANDRAAVVIDAASLPASSFPTPFGRTGVVRIGRRHHPRPVERRSVL